MTKRSFLSVLFITCLCTTGAWSQNRARFSDVKAGMKNRDLEMEALMVANKRAATTRCREEFSRAVIVSDGWETERNAEGIITGRHLHMELYGETDDNRCGMSHCIFRQNVQGDDRYSGKLKLVDMGPFYDLECK
jgi:hypothetical protein